MTSMSLRSRAQLLQEERPFSPGFSKQTKAPEVPDSRPELISDP